MNWNKRQILSKNDKTGEHEKSVNFAKSVTHPARYQEYAVEKIGERRMF